MKWGASVCVCMCVCALFFRSMYDGVAVVIFINMMDGYLSANQLLMPNYAKRLSASASNPTARATWSNYI